MPLRHSRLTPDLHHFRPQRLSRRIAGDNSEVLTGHPLWVTKRMNTRMFLLSFVLSIVSFILANLLCKHPGQSWAF